MNIQRSSSLLRTAFRDHPEVLDQRLVLSFNSPKKEGQGEDADPLVCETGQTQWIGVFDGMGGAGATAYETVEGRRSGAYLASRVTAGLCAKWAVADADKFAPGQRAASLHDAISRGLVQQLEALAPSKSRIRGSLLKSLPTTVALAAARDVGHGYVECNVLWAGDSRVYNMTPERGLVQLSVDHLERPLDAQQNLTADSPLSNFANANAPFFIEEIVLQIQQPLLLIAATDGCFGYVYSPAHFERMLLAALTRSQNPADFECILRSHISEIGGDDASIAITQFGWHGWETLRTSFQQRFEIVAPRVDALDAIRHKVKLAEDALQAVSCELADAKDGAWASYRVGYEAQCSTTRGPS